MGIYAQAAGVILLFAFLFFIFLAGKGWRWHHVTTLVLLFLCSFFFVFLAASVLKTHQVWRTREHQTAEQLEQVQEQIAVLTNGPPNPATGEEESIVGLRNELKRVLTDRGRVWRELPFAKEEGDRISVQFPPRNVVGVDTPPPPHRMQQNAIVYAFKQTVNPENMQVPGLYMGEWVVENIAPDRVLLSHLQPLDQVQRRQLDTGGTLTLYEVMPNDGHHKFAHLSDDQIRELLMPGGWHTRPAMAPEERYQESVDQYLRDGGNHTPADPPERTWVEVELTQPWSQDVDVDPESTATNLPTQAFQEVTGLALSPDLQQGGPSEFEPGDKIILDWETAESLIEQGIANRLRNIYRRPLRDYAYSFGEIYRRVRELNDEIRQTTDANTTVQAAIDKAKQQIAIRTEAKTRLGEDLAFVSKERDAMKQYLSTLQDQYADVRATLYQLYTSNLELVDELRRIEEAITRAIRQQLAAVGE